MLLAWGAYLVFLGRLLPMQIDLSFPEASVVHAALRVAQGESAYTDWRIWPHQIAPYGPLTYYIPGWAAHALHPSSPTHALIYGLGRAQACLSLLAIFCLVPAICRRAGVRPVLALLALGLLGGYAFLWRFSISFRPDAPRTALTLAAIFIAMGDEPTRKRALAAWSLLWVSAWFKMTAWGTGLALLAWHCRGKGWRSGLIAFGIFSGFGVGLAMTLNTAMQGRFLLNLLDSMQAQLSLTYLRNYLAEFIQSGNVLLVAGLGCAVLGLTRRDQPPSVRVLMHATLASFFCTLFQVLRPGADHYYWLDVFPLAICALAWGLNQLTLPPHNALPWRAWAQATAVVFLVAISARECLRAIKPGDLRLGNDPLPIQTWVSSLKRPVLSVQPWIGLKSNQPVVLDFYHYSLLVQAGLLDPGPLRDRIRTQAFEAIVLYADQAALDQIGDYYLEDFAELLVENYTPVGDKPFSIWVPK